MRRTGKAAAMTKAVQEAGGERTIGMSNGSRRTAEDNERRARVSGTFADNREVKSAVGARLSNAKRRQCPSAGKSCVSAVMPRAARIGEPNRPGRNMKQQRPTHGFRQRRCPCRRGEGMRRAGILRSVYVRTHDARDNRGIRPEICPNIRTARNFFENFKKISFSVQRKGKKYRLYNIRDNHGEYLHPERRRGGAPLCVRAKLHRESESACATINAACAKSVGKAPDINISSQIFTPNAAPDRTASSESGFYSIRAFPYCKIRQSML